MSNNKKPLFLIIDDDNDFRLSITESYILLDFADLYGLDSCEAAYEFLNHRHKEVNLIILDYDFRLFGSGNQLNGLEFLEIITKKWPSIPVVMMSGVNDIRGKVAIESMKKLAYEYLDKPFDVEEIIKIYNQFTSNHLSFDKKIKNLKNTLDNFGFITNHKKLLEKIQLGIESLQKKHDRIILINGETGSGKSLLANIIHKIVSNNNNEPAVVHCSNLGNDINTIRDFLFGHTKNSWTGATNEKPSIFKGIETVIFDDIQHISKEAQKVLLEVFQERRYSVFGKEATKEKIESRFIVTSTMSPEQLVQLGFLEEFVNRISAEIISIPPLNKRIEDIPLLIEKFSKKYKDRKIKFDKNLIESYIITNYENRNIRELEHFIDNLIVHSNSNFISYDVLRKILSVKNDDKEEVIYFGNPFKEGYNLEDELADLRKIRIELALKKFKGNIKKASEALGYKNHNGLIHWIKKLNLDVNNFK